MINPTQKTWRPLAAPALNWQEDVPVAANAGDIYFSTENGLAESSYVFLEGNELRDRWSTVGVEPVCDCRDRFWTGLNACLTLADWLKDRPEGGSLHYIALNMRRSHPLTLKEHCLDGRSWNRSSPSGAWPDPIPGHRSVSPNGTSLGSLVGDAAEVWAAWRVMPRHGSMLYLDGFAPSGTGRQQDV